MVGNAATARRMMIDKVLISRTILMGLMLLAGCSTPANELLSAGGSANAESLPAARDKAAPAAAFGPLVDHHLHLLSPAAAAFITPPLLPEIGVPAEFATLLRDRERHWNNEGALASLYTENALYFGGGTAGWAQGRKAVARHAEWSFVAPYRLKPTRFSRENSSATLAGYLVKADGSDRHLGFFLLALVRSSDGRWRIGAETFHNQAPGFEKPSLAAQLVASLDAVGIKRGVVLSNAYYFDGPRWDATVTPAAELYPMVRAENDWAADQVSQFPDRLVAFCSFNALQPYALEELERCANSRRFRGLKLHFNAAQLKFADPKQVAKVRRVMEAANRHRLPIIMHVRPGNMYGRKEAEIFLRQILAAAPDVPIQIAHLWGGESFSSAALAVYADAVAAADPATRNLYFDVSGLTYYGRGEDMEEIVTRMRQIGMDRMLYASDSPPAEAWEALRTRVPLTSTELRTIATNIAPYMKIP